MNAKMRIKTILKKIEGNKYEGDSELLITPLVLKIKLIIIRIKEIIPNVIKNLYAILLIFLFQSFSITSLFHLTSPSQPLKQLHLLLVLNEPPHIRILNDCMG